MATSWNVPDHSDVPSRSPAVILPFAEPLSWRAEACGCRAEDKRREQNQPTSQQQKRSLNLSIPSVKHQNRAVCPATPLYEHYWFLKAWEILLQCLQHPLLQMLPGNDDRNNTHCSGCFTCITLMLGQGWSSHSSLSKCFSLKRAESWDASWGESPGLLCSFSHH